VALRRVDLQVPAGQSGFSSRHAITGKSLTKSPLFLQAAAEQRPAPRVI
jgi:hypothetical protein